MTTLTPEDRNALRALAENATPGPWHPHPRYVWTSELGGIIQNWSEDANASADMEFIAAARTAVPQLLDRLDRAQAALDRVRKHLTAWVDEYGHEVYQGNGWAEGVRDAAREALKDLDG